MQPTNVNTSVAGLSYHSVNGSSLVSVTENGKTREVSIPELFMLISFKLSETGQARIREQTEKMQINNAVVASLNEKISKLSALQAYVPADQKERKKVSELIRDSSEEAKRLDKEAKDYFGKAESSRKNYESEAQKWNERGYGRAMSYEMARDPNTPRDAIVQALKNAGIIKTDPKTGKTSQPGNLNDNIDRLRSNWADYNHWNGEHKKSADALYNLTKDPIKQAFLGLGGFATEGVRDAKGELQRNPDGSIKLGGATMNLLENFKAKTHGVPIDDIEVNGADLDALITHLKGKIEAYNSRSQLDMIDLQKFVSENNRYFDMASNMISKGAQSLQSIVGNIRG